jgi:hypothetical protein
MEQLSISSFLQNGHSFHLYIYDDVEGIPNGTTIKDANKILPSSKIFKYKNHDSYAGFANLFRYKLLLERGSYWVDTDIICLKPFQDKTEYVFAGQRKQKKGFFQFKRETIVNNCLIKAPAGSAIMDYCFSESDGKDPEKLAWGETGPVLLTPAVKKFDLWGYVEKPEIFCSIDWWNWRQFINKSPDEKALRHSQAVHLWNEMWRRDNIDKSDAFPEECIYEQLKKRYFSNNA